MNNDWCKNKRTSMDIDLCGPEDENGEERITTGVVTVSYNIKYI
jgi:hypothetical protein